jgi:D-arabinose 1-dehydrogenase-like Zn-dependent alcohol dehydrogenase
MGLGADVTRFQEGDRVVPIYTQGWISGGPTPEMRSKRTLGVPLDGVLREYIALSAEDAVHAPANLCDVEAANMRGDCNPGSGFWRWARAALPSSRSNSRSSRARKSR